MPAKLLTSTEAFDGLRWSYAEPMPVAALFPSVAVHEGKAYLLGGYSLDAGDQVGCPLLAYLLPGPTHDG